jgi:hypothetical protein
MNSYHCKLDVFAALSNTHTCLIQWNYLSTNKFLMRRSLPMRGAILQLFDIKANINACDANLYTDDIEGNVD